MKGIYPIRVEFYKGGNYLLVADCPDRRTMARHAQALADRHNTIIYIANAATHLLLGWSWPRRWEGKR